MRAVCEPIVFAPPPDAAIRVGEVSAAAGRAAYDTIVRAVDAASEATSMRSRPRRSTSWPSRKAGLQWKGHTDLLAHLCGTPRVAMMFHSPQLKVVLITVHVPLRDVSALITPELVDQTIALTVEAMTQLRHRTPRLALAGLNPHAGEAACIGSEDDRVLAPAVARARARGVDDRRDRFPATPCSCAPRAANSTA